jgi:Holin of 3TMs, for gene-transfer release
MNKLSSQWRPVLMFVLIAIIANNYILYPYLALIFRIPPMPAIPDQLWTLIHLFAGTYTVGRSVEKVIPTIATILNK